MTAQEKLMNELTNMGFLTNSLPFLVNPNSDGIKQKPFCEKTTKNEYGFYDQVVVLVYEDVGKRFAYVGKLIRGIANKKKMFFLGEKPDDEVVQDVIDYIKKLKEWNGEDETDNASNK